MKLKLLAISALVLAACLPEPDPQPKSPIQKAAVQIYDTTLEIRSELRTFRDSTTVPSEKLATLTVMSILASGVKLILQDLYWRPSTDISQLGRLEALDAELDVAQSDAILDYLPSDISGRIRDAVEIGHAEIAEAKLLFTLPATTHFSLSSGWINFLKKYT